MLGPSKRIAYIREIASRLKDEEWSLIDLTLKQFNLPRTDDWSGSKYDYLVHMTEDAIDQALIELAQHCGYDGEDHPQTSIEPSFWRKDMLRVFLSHLSAHKGEVAKLQEAFLTRGISGFVAHNDIEPTVEWQGQIETASSTCDALVALLHPGFHQSNWTDQEIGFAMGRGVPVFAVHYGEAPYGFLGKMQAFSGVGKTAFDLSTDIFKRLIKHKQTQRRMAEVVVALFEASDSYDQANARASHLELLEVWEHSFSTRLLTAVKSNSQISEAWHAPSKVFALVKKWTPDYQDDLLEG